MKGHLVRRPFPETRDESVHRSDYPEPDESVVDRALSQVMASVRAIVSLGLQVRTAEKLGEEDPDTTATIVFIVCDGGWKYLSTGAWTDDLDEVVERAKKIIYF